MRVVVSSVLAISLLASSAWAVEAPPDTAPTPSSPAAVATPQAATPVTTTAPPAPATLPAARPTTPPTGAANSPINNKGLTAEQLAKHKVQQDAAVKSLVKDQETRLQQLEKANLVALAQNQELQLKNDNLGVQLQVLQTERSAQMFLYGAVTVVMGVLLGFLLAGYIYNKRRRQW
jgi:hypothetical protein